MTVTSEVARIRAEHAHEPRASLFCASALPLTVRAALSVQPSENFTKISKIQSIYQMLLEACTEWIRVIGWLLTMVHKILDYMIERIAS
jgi:hypothetical protein